MTELELHNPAEMALTAQMDYARAVAVSSLLPNEYRGKPENVLIAMGLGAAMGLAPAESLYRISVIQGKPTANAELIAASVRRAGHKLRVSGDDTTCTATIIRHDDPEHEFTVTRDVKWAQSMGLASKDNYKKQPGTMLQWRAITAVARLACSEALYGVAYTSDELSDMRPDEPAAEPQSGRERLASAVTHVESQLGGEEVEQTDTQPEPITDKQIKALNAAASDLGLTREQKLAGIAATIGREVESSKLLTKAEATRCIRSLNAAIGQRGQVDPDAEKPADVDAARDAAQADHEARA